MTPTRSSLTINPLVALLLLAASPAHATPFNDALTCGWSALQTQDLDIALRCYARATTLSPASEDAWLGLQLTHLIAHRYPEALAAGTHALALSPQNYWAQSRQALIHYHLAQFNRAATLYRALLKDAPADTSIAHAELRLGLGLSLARAGDIQAGHAACALAQQRLGPDPRIAACLSIRPRPWHGTLTLTGSLFTLTDPWALSDLQSLTLAATAQSPSGLTLWAGAALSQGTQTYAADNYQQATPALGLSLLTHRFLGALSAAWVFASSELANHTPVFTARAAYWGPTLGAGLNAALSIYPQQTSERPLPIQLTPWLDWHALTWLTASLSATLTLIPSDRNTELLPAAAATFTVRISEPLSAALSGSLGPRRYPVEADGLSVWTGNERFIGTVATSLTYTPLPALSLLLNLRADFGDEQAGRDHRFDMFSGTFGVRANL